MAKSTNRQPTRRGLRSQGLDVGNEGPSPPKAANRTKAGPRGSFSAASTISKANPSSIESQGGPSLGHHEEAHQTSGRVSTVHDNKQVLPEHRQGKQYLDEEHNDEGKEGITDEGPRKGHGGELSNLDTPPEPSTTGDHSDGPYIAGIPTMGYNPTRANYLRCYPNASPDEDFSAPYQPRPSPVAPQEMLRSVSPGAPPILRDSLKRKAGESEDPPLARPRRHVPFRMLKRAKAVTPVRGFLKEINCDERDNYMQ